MKRRYSTGRYPIKTAVNIRSIENTMKDLTNKLNVPKAISRSLLLTSLMAGVIGAISLPASGADQFADFWLTQSAGSKQHSSHNNTVSVQTQLVQKNADRPYVNQYSDEFVSSFISTENTDGNGVTVLSRYSDFEYSSAIEGKVGNFSVTSSTGRGERFGRTISQYNGLDPYAFHGGNLSEFRYQGSAIGYQFAGQHQIQFGRTVVKADRLEDRTSDYIDYSSNGLFARYTQISRGADSVGYGMDFGMSVGRFDVAYQRLSSRYDASTDRVRVQWNQSANNQFGFEFSEHKNTLLNFHTDSRMMLTWHHTFGSSLPVSHAASAANAKGKKKSGNGGRRILIGGAAAAAALLLSSGSDEQDSAERVMPQGNGLVRNVQAQHDAARQRLNMINPVSVNQNREFGGYIYQSADGSYASTQPIRGEAASVSLPIPSLGVPAGTFARASYHTHAAFDPRFDNENFSPTDLAGDREFDIDGYLGTPGGRFLYHEVSTGAISQLGRVNN